MTTASISLQDWRAWQPGRDSHDDPNGNPRLSVAERPKGASVPAMLGEHEHPNRNKDSLQATRLPADTQVKD